VSNRETWRTVALGYFAAMAKRNGSRVPETEQVLDRSDPAAQRTRCASRLAGAGGRPWI
jgi:hypothetical protein